MNKTIENSQTLTLGDTAGAILAYQAVHAMEAEAPARAMREVMNQVIDGSRSPESVVLQGEVAALAVSGLHKIVAGPDAWRADQARLMLRINPQHTAEQPFLRCDFPEAPEMVIDQLDQTIDSIPVFADIVEL